MTRIDAPPSSEEAEALVVEAYERGWREGCETMIEDYPDAPVAVPHNDAMGEGCGTFMGEIRRRIAALPSTAIDELVEALLHWDKQAETWLGTRADNARPGWMRPAIDKGRAALTRHRP